MKPCPTQCQNIFEMSFFWRKLDHHQCSGSFLLDVDWKKKLQLKWTPSILLWAPHLSHRLFCFCSIAGDARKQTRRPRQNSALGPSSDSHRRRLAKSKRKKIFNEVEELAQFIDKNGRSLVFFEHFHRIQIWELLPKYSRIDRT
jgi:hypothetical protein